MISWNAGDGYYYQGGRKIGRWVAWTNLWLGKRPRGYLFGLAVPSLTDHGRNLRYLAKRIPRSLRARVHFAREVDRYAESVRRKYPLPFTVAEAMKSADLATLSRWVKFRGPPAFFRGQYIRVNGKHVETSSGRKYPVAMCRKLLAKIDEGRRLGIFAGHDWYVFDDVLRVGCHEFSLRQVRSELSRAKSG